MKRLQPRSRTSRPPVRWLVALGLAAFFSASGFAYDYATPMGEVASLPLAMPQKPFVLRFSQEELQQQPIWSKQVDGILISNVADPVVRLAAQTLRDALIGAGFGDAFIVEAEPSLANLPPQLEGKHVLVLGRPADLVFIRRLVEQEKLRVTDEALNGDGFVVRPVKHGAGDLLLVTSCVSRGVLYGAYELEERTTSRGVPALDQAFVPAVRNRSWSFYNFIAEPPDTIGRSRYNWSIHYFGVWPGVLGYPGFPELNGADHVKERIDRQKTVHQLMAEAMKYGATPAVIFNPFTFTASPSSYSEARATLARTHPTMMAKPWGPFGTDLSHPKASIHTLNRFNLCPSDPATKRFVEDGVRELIRTFPEIGMLGLMFSDEGGELICGCDRCRQWPYLDRITEYSQLIVRVARSENPNIRFMPFVHGINWWIPLHQPEYENRSADALVELYHRMNGDFDGMMMLRSTPPGGDLQSWLFPTSTMLGRGVPLFYFFHSYEAGGPGMVAPVSNVLSHLTWPLPVYLDQLQAFLKPGQGMVGGASPIAGMDVAWWYPNLDPQSYMLHWCQAKYGLSAGAHAYQALVETHKITEAFYLENKPEASESFTLYRWRAENYLRPYAGDMSPLKSLAADGVTAAEGLAPYDFMVPQARQPAALQAVRPTQMASWQERFEINEPVAIAQRAEKSLAQALAEKPDSPDLQRLHQAAVATVSLTRLFREYHLALLQANLGRNSSAAAGRQQWIDGSREHLRNAIVAVVDYAGAMIVVTHGDLRPYLARFRLDVERLYVGTSLCLVREAARQFDEEFGGESLTGFYDQAIAAKVASHPGAPAR